MAKSGGKAAAKSGGYHVKKLSPKGKKTTDKQAKKGGKSKLPFGKAK